MKIDDTVVARYKLVTLNNKDQYLIDLDTNKLTWLFPMLTWYSKNRAFRVDSVQYKKLKVEKKVKTGTSMWSFSGFMLGGVVYSILKGLESIFFKEITANLLLLSFVFIIPIVFLFRYIRSIVSYKKMEKKLCFSKEESFGGFISIKESDDNIYYKKRCIQATLISGAVLIFLLFVYIESATLLMIPVLFAYLVFISLINTAILKPFSDMNYSYTEYDK